MIKCFIKFLIPYITLSWNVSNVYESQSNLKYRLCEIISNGDIIEKTK